MAKQTFTTGQVLLASQLTSLQQTAMNGGAFSAKTSSYTLVAADAGTAISMTSTSATTVTVNTGLFAAGDTVLITNLGSGACVITAGTATVNTAGSLSLSQYEAGLLHFVSASSAVFNDYVQAASNPLTTTGDMIYSSSGSTQARLGIGSTSQVLTVSGGIPAWATPAASGGMTLLETLTLSGASVTSSSISGTYKHLFVVVKNATNSSNADFILRMNGDSGANYLRNVVITSGTSTLSASVVSGQTEIRLQDIGSATGAGQRTRGNFWIVRYTDTDETYVTAQFLGYEGSQKATVINAVYDNSAAITTITLGVNSGTMSNGNAYIYGVN
jgi:hypothetical protein